MAYWEFEDSSSEEESSEEEEESEEEEDDEDDEDDEEDDEDDSEDDPVDELTNYDNYREQVSLEKENENRRTATVSPHNEIDLRTYVPPKPKLIPPKIIAPPPKVSWKQGLHLVESTPASVALEALEKKIQNNNNYNQRNAGGVTRKRNLNDDNDGIDDNQPAWKASKKQRGSGWGLVL